MQSSFQVGMDANSWRSTQGRESAADSGDWKSGIQPESREKIVLKIMDNLKKCIPHNDGTEGLHELKKIATNFEEKIFFAATDQTDYLRQLSLKMLAMESHKLTMNSMPPDSVVSSSQNPQDSGGSNCMQTQVVNQGKQMPMQTGNTQVQERQQIQNSIVPGDVPGSSGLTSAMSSISGLPSNNMLNVASQNPNVQNIQNMSGVPQNLVGNAMGQGVSSSMSQQQRQIQGGQQITPQQQQQQQKQQSQNHQNYLYQQQQLLMKSMYQQGKISHSVMQSHMQQQDQQHPNIMQSSVMQSGSLSGLQQNQQISVQQPTQTGMQQNSQSVFRQQQQTVQSMQQQQTSMMHQQQKTVQSIQQQPQQQIVQSMQQHQLSNATDMQQNLTGQQNSISDMQQQQQRSLSQENNLPNMQQQQLTSQTNNLPNMRHQQMSSLNNAVRLPQQSLVTQSGSSNMLTNQHTLQMMQQSKVTLQPQSQHGNTTVFPSLGQPSQQQPSSHQSMAQIQSQTGQLQQQLGMQQQQSMAQIQSQTGQLQQQLSMQHQQQLNMQQKQQLGMQHQQQSGMQQQPNLVQRDMQQGLQTSDPLLQQQNKFDPQKQLALSEASSTSLDSTVQKGTTNSVDWQEETYQKITAMKETYLLDLVEMYQRISVKLQQHDPVSELSQYEQSEKLLLFKTMVERIIALLQITKCNVLPIYREKLHFYERQIINILASNRPQYKQGSTMPPGQQPGQSHILQSMQQQTHGNQMNTQIQQTGVQNSMSTIPQNSTTDQGNHLNNMLAVSVRSLQQNPISAPQQVNLNALQPNFSSVQSNASKLPSQQMLQTQPLKQHSQMQQQLVHRQIHQEQQTQQLMQQQQAQFQSPQMSQMNEINDLKTRQQLAPKSGLQRSAYQHQQMKSNTSFPISSPQILQTAASPQVLQQPSPQIDQQNILSSLTRTGTPLQYTNSPLVLPSPSTPFVPSPRPGESERVGSGVGNIRQSLGIGTPGISASPLIEFTSQEIHANASAAVSGKSNVTELPMDRLIRVVKSMSPSALSDSVSDIGSVVGMFDGIAGSAPGNGSRAAVGEDLAAMTKCRLQTNNISMQDGSPGTRKMKRYTTANSVNSNEDSDSDSAATSYFKRPRLEDNHSLLEEIREINEQLIDTVVDISDEKLDDTADPAEGGTIVKCFYSAVSLSPAFKSQYAFHQMLSIQPLRLLVPKNYPNCSPTFLDKFMTEPSKDSEDLSVKAQLRFSINVRTLSQPMSLGEIAKTWDECSREVIIEYAQQKGGGTFSSKYGSW